MFCALHIAVLFFPSILLPAPIFNHAVSQIWGLWDLLCFHMKETGGLFFSCVKVIALFKTKQNMHACIVKSKNAHELCTQTCSCTELEVLNTRRGPRWDFRGEDPSSSSRRLSALSSSALPAHIINNLIEEETRTTVTSFDLWWGFCV